MVKKDDFVILSKNFKNIELNSVGFVKAVINEDVVKVFFIGIKEEVILSQDFVSFLDVTKTGKPYEYKICNVCHILKKDFIDFEINQTDAKGRKTTRPSCKKCRIEIDGVGLKPDEKRKLELNKPLHYFICPICEKGSIPGVTANLVKDHSHKTGEAREWLCDSCNTGLGRFKDDVQLLKKAIEYLEKHKNN